ncbi:MAG TPA: prepilin peptidase [Pseudolabrys sp.]|jgi:leader peptidase (prepilin peptidase)/N-methyltransferase
MKQIRPAAVAVGLIGLTAAAASIGAVSGTSGYLGAGLALLMLAIAALDYRYLIIPNELNAAALALAVINAVVADPAAVVDGLASAALRGLVTMLVFLAIRTAYRWLRQREGLGLGDVKLAFVAGAWLDWLMIPLAIEIAALAALVTYGAWRVFGSRPIGPMSRLPFGLFFAPAIWLSWLIGALIAAL